MERPKAWNDPQFWKDNLVGNGALWTHDGNPKRPYALMTNKGQEMVSDTYIDFTKVAIHPAALEVWAGRLLDTIRKTSVHFPPETVFVGQAMGSITFAYALARVYGNGMPFFASPDKDGNIRMDPRFDGIVKKHWPILLVDDVHHIGGSCELAREGLAAAGYTRVLPYVAVAVNRMGPHKCTDRRVISVLELETRVWPLGANPYTKDGQELLPPVRPKKDPRKHLLYDAL